MGVIYGETLHSDVPLLNTRWPQRGLYYVTGTTEGGQFVRAYVWDDCEGDAIESVLEWCGEEGSDDLHLVLATVCDEERTAIVRTTNEFNARDE